MSELNIKFNSFHSKECYINFYNSHSIYYLINNYVCKNQYDFFIIVFLI